MPDLPGNPYAFVDDSELDNITAPGPEVLEKAKEYQTWGETNSKVLSGPLGPNANFPGTRHLTWTSAKAAAEGIAKGAANVFYFFTVPGRWIARVRR